MPTEIPSSTSGETKNESILLREVPKVVQIYSQADSPCPRCRCKTLCIVAIKFTQSDKNYEGTYAGCPACGWHSDTVAKPDSGIISV